MNSDEEVFDKLYRFHQLICGKFGREQPVTRDDILTISGFSPVTYKKCYNSAIQAIRLKCPRTSSYERPS